jgi:hypothetical protein
MRLFLRELFRSNVSLLGLSRPGRIPRLGYTVRNITQFVELITSETFSQRCDRPFLSSTWKGMVEDNR